MSGTGATKKIIVIGGVPEALVSFRGPLLRAFVERGHHVTACAPEAPPTVIDALTAMGVSYRDVPYSRTGLRPDQDLHDLYALVVLFREIRPDIVLSYTMKPVVYSSLVARLLVVPSSFSMIEGLGYAFTSGNGVKRRLIRIIARLLYRLSLRGNRRVFFLNPDDRALFEQLKMVRKPDQSVLLHGIGIDLEAFRPAPLPAPTSFLLMARLLGDKGIREYVDAARILRAKHPGAAFRVAGWIDDHPTAISDQELRAWIDEGAIEYLGRLDDVRPAIAEASVYVLPSYREGTPRTVLEAMAMGRPIVTTDAPGCRETVLNGVNGYLVPVRDVPALVAALERFIGEPALIEAMGRESRRIAVEKYDVHQVNAVILEAMGLD